MPISQRLAQAWCFICLLSALLGAAGGESAALGDRFDAVRERIHAEVDAGTVPSLAVAVARNGEILWEEAFGWADREAGIPATVHTLYPLASVSKPFTATGLMVLVERGAVDLERPANDYLGEAELRSEAGDASRATVLSLANHTSGLPLHHHFLPAGDADRRPPVEETIRRYGVLVAPPGERYQYSNLGYAVLEHLVAQVSGQSFADFMQREVFRPLGLEHTSVAGGVRPGDDQAVLYRSDGEPILPYVSDHGGGSAMVSCVHDLVRFGSFHLGIPLPEQEAILSRRTLRRMQRPGVGRSDATGFYGIGWTIHDEPAGYRTIMHTGGMPGVGAALVLIPSSRIAVAALASTRTDLPYRISREIVAELLPREARYRAAVETRRQTPSGTSRAAGRTRLPRRLTGTWSGAIHTPRGPLPLTLAVARSGVSATVGDQPPAGLFAVRSRHGSLVGLLQGILEQEEGKRGLVRFCLDSRGDLLAGAVTELSVSGEELPSALSYWLELHRNRE